MTRETCGICEGKRMICKVGIYEQCPRCAGKGYIEDEEAIIVSEEEKIQALVDKEIGRLMAEKEAEKPKVPPREKFLTELHKKNKAKKSEED